MYQYTALLVAGYLFCQCTDGLLWLPPPHWVVCWLLQCHLVSAFFHLKGRPTPCGISKLAWVNWVGVKLLVTKVLP
jgi:hypothetical protein